MFGVARAVVVIVVDAVADVDDDTMYNLIEARTRTSSTSRPMVPIAKFNARAASS